MGEPYMIPTKDQCQELIDNTTSLFGRGVRKFISKTDSLKYIFLPAGGEWYDWNYNYKGHRGNFWSTTIYADDNSRGWYFYFIEDKSNMALNMSRNSRRYGFSIRPVRQL